MGVGLGWQCSGMLSLWFGSCARPASRSGGRRSLRRWRPSLHLLLLLALWLMGGGVITGRSRNLGCAVRDGFPLLKEECGVGSMGKERAVTDLRRWREADRRRAARP